MESESLEFCKPLDHLSLWRASILIWNRHQRFYVIRRLRDATFYIFWIRRSAFLIFVFVNRVDNLISYGGLFFTLSAPRSFWLRGPNTSSRTLCRPVIECPIRLLEITKETGRFFLSLIILVCLLLHSRGWPLYGPTSAMWAAERWRHPRNLQISDPLP